MNKVLYNINYIYDESKNNEYLIIFKIILISIIPIILYYFFYLRNISFFNIFEKLSWKLSKNNYEKNDFSFENSEIKKMKNSSLFWDDSTIMNIFKINSFNNEELLIINYDKNQENNINKLII